VNPNSTNKLVITVKDNRDGLLDSAVFLKAGSFGVVAPPIDNNAPTGKPTAILDSTPEDTDIIINESDLLLGFKDIDGDTLSITNFVANNGTLVDNGNNSFTFTPTGNFYGSVDLTYDVTDGIAPLVGQQQSFKVTPVNKPPTAITFSNIVTTIAENTALINRLKVADISITDDGLGLNNLALGGGDAGSFELDGNALYLKAGTILDFETKNNLNLVVTVDDVTVGNSPDAASPFTLNITDVNESPAGEPTAILPNTSEDTAITINSIDLLKTFTDVDGNKLSIVNLAATNGSLIDKKDGTYTFTPNANFNGTVNLTYDVTDGIVNLTGQTRSFNVTPVNDAPTGKPTGKLSDTPENTAITIKAIDLLTGFSDVDGDKLSVKNLTATNGILINKDDGTGDYLFTPTTNFVGSVNLVYDITDGTVDLSGQSLGFKILAVNKPPTAITFSNTLTTIAENTVITQRLKVADINITDDGLGVNTLDLGGGDAGSFELDSNTLYLKAGTILDYELKKSLNLVVNVDDATVGPVPDATSPFTLNITDINESPTRKPIGTKLPDGAEDTPLIIKDSDLLAGYSDTDGDNTLSIKNLAASNGKLVDNKNGTHTFTPNTDYSGIVNFTFDVTDGTSTLVGESNKSNIVATPPSFLAPINASSGLLQLSQGAGSTSLLFTKIAHQAGNRNELGIFVVDDDKGTVNNLLPGQQGYLAEVTKRSKVVFSSLGESAIDTALDANFTRTIDMAANAKLGFYLALNNSIDSTLPPNVLFSFPTTTGGFQSAQTTKNAKGVQLAFEDVPGGGDKDFNDLVVQIETVTTVAPLGITQQSSKEIFDLTAITTPVKVTFEVKRDAWYNNHISLYKIEDAQGTIKVGTNLLKPTDAGYRAAAVQGRIAGIDLVGANGQNVTSNASLQGGALYAPLLIVNSATANANFSNVYTAYSLGNADLVDHVRLLGDNTFGFEDMAGGGDRDFNDVIVKATFTL
jgi:Cadherin-like domain/Domain of unknown function (DUF4114)